MTDFAGLNTPGNAAGFVGGGGGAITPTQLNAAFPYGQWEFSADRFTIDVVDPAIKTNVQIGTLEKTLTAIKFLPGVDTEAELSFIIKDFQIDNAAPNFKLFPVWYQLDDVADPGDAAVIEGYIQVKNLGNTINTAFDVAPSGVKITSPTKAQWIITSGNSSSDENPIIIAATGDSLAAGTNLIQVQIERHGGDVADDYLNPIYLLGIAIQYKHDFNNVQEWATV